MGPFAAEIVVVDNASDDNTSAIVREWAGQCSFPVRLLFEPRPGQTFARNTGIRAARGDLLLWTDDDCRMDRDYIVAALRYDGADTELVLRGGRVELGDAEDLPVSIKTGAVAQRYHKDKYPAKNGNPAGALIGANMMMRRALVDRLGFFDERFGPGTSLPAADDIDYIFRAYLAGVMIEYVPDMVVFHHHGRRQPAQGYNVIRNYLIASGGLYTKYLFKSPALCRVVWWDFRNAVREFISGRSNYMPELGLSYKKLIFLHLIGAFRYLVSSVIPWPQTARAVALASDEATALSILRDVS
jgi:glycosyltransferase involved in cell wall biosynthesis